MKFYIIDTTISNTPISFDNLSEIINHLEGTVRRKFSLTRSQYMQNLIDLGYGYDDKEGANFVSSLSEHFDIGVIRAGQYLRTNIHESINHNKYRKEYGN